MTSVYACACNWDVQPATVCVLYIGPLRRVPTPMTSVCGRACVMGPLGFHLQPVRHNLLWRASACDLSVYGAYMRCDQRHTAVCYGAHLSGHYSERQSNVMQLRHSRIAQQAGTQARRHLRAKANWRQVPRQKPRQSATAHPHKDVGVRNVEASEIGSCGDCNWQYIALRNTYCAHKQGRDMIGSKVSTAVGEHGNGGEYLEHSAGGTCR
jgi:hypothetical protein